MAWSSQKQQKMDGWTLMSFCKNFVHCEIMPVWWFWLKFLLCIHINWHNKGIELVTACSHTHNMLEQNSLQQPRDLTFLFINGKVISMPWKTFEYLQIPCETFSCFKVSSAGSVCVSVFSPWGCSTNGGVWPSCWRPSRRGSVWSANPGGQRTCRSERWWTSCCTDSTGSLSTTWSPHSHNALGGGNNTGDRMTNQTADTV